MNGVFVCVCMCPVSHLECRFVAASKKSNKNSHNSTGALRIKIETSDTDMPLEHDFKQHPTTIASSIWIIYNDDFHLVRNRGCDLMMPWGSEMCMHVFVLMKHAKKLNDGDSFVF